MELRPHHLLCIQGYHGVGYSEGFVDNMSHVVKQLRDNPEQQIMVNRKSDVLCSACPGKEKGCSSCGAGCGDGLVARLDKETLKWLGISEGEHVYGQLVEYINEHLTWEVYSRICSQCEWFKNDVCSLKEKLR